MASKKEVSANALSEDDPDVKAAARAIVAAKRRNQAADANPWWICPKCDHRNHPRAGFPNDKCESCGYDRDVEGDRIYDPGVNRA